VPLLAQTPTLSTGSAHFEIFQGDKTVGSTDYTIATGPTGYTINSRGDFKLAKFSYSFTNNNQLDSGLNTVRDQLSGTVNGSEVSFKVNADSTGRQLQINVDAKGKQTTNTVDRHRNLVFMPDLDASAYVLLTRFAIANPPTSWVLIPKQDGLLVPSDFKQDADLQGTLNGQKISLKHTSVAVSAQNAVGIELYYKPDGTLMEADLIQQNFFVVREGFKLLNRPAVVPPRDPDATLPPQQQQQDQQQQQAPPPPPQAQVQ
jgi:hypothetical protein